MRMREFLLERFVLPVGRSTFGSLPEFHSLAQASQPAALLNRNSVSSIDGP
jgi:hypothetical protein